MVSTLCIIVKTSSSPILFLNLCDASKETCVYASLSKAKKLRKIKVYMITSVIFNSEGFQYLSSFFCFPLKNNQVSNYMFQAKETFKRNDLNCV